MGTTREFEVYPYRWAILATYMLITAMVQVQWLTHAPVARAAEVFYAGQFDPDSIVNIDFLAVTYMLLFLIFSIPASYVIDTFGIRIGIGLGAALAGIAGISKGIFGSNFQIVVICQLVLAISQPFIINAVTAVSVRWFPLNERGVAAGMSALAQYVGIIMVMLVTPAMVVTSPAAPDYGQGIDRMLLVYGVMTLVAAVIALLIIREKPATPPSGTEIERHPFHRGLGHIFKLGDMRWMILVFFIGLGIFNAISSMVDAIASSLGVEDSDGLIGGIMLIGGVIGAIIIPALSDKSMKRKRYMVICMAGMVPGIVLLSFAGHLTGGPGVNPDAAYTVALIGSFLMGFFVMSAGPIGFQYAAELSSPAPESTSQGLLLLSGQISGLAFVMGMSMEQNRYLPQFLFSFTILAVVAFLIVTRLKESPMALKMRRGPS
ncbi:MAG: MFS transporter [Myxococcota bacterium]|nr:MFS transporter [Myxococcota bacterium]